MHDEIITGKKNLKDFLIDVQEEIMDALLYIEAAKEILDDEIIYSSHGYPENKL